MEKNFKESAIFGTGMYGEIVYNYLESKNYNVLFFIDELTDKKDFLGLPVFSLTNVPRKDIEIFIGVSHSNSIIEES